MKDCDIAINIIVVPRGEELSESCNCASAFRSNQLLSRYIKIMLVLGKKANLLALGQKRKHSIAQ